MMKNIDCYNNKFAAFFWSFFTILFAYFVFGFYYERYEPLPVFLFSGVLTPGMIYDDLFYLAYIGLAKVFGNLYFYFPSIPWISVFQYSLLFFSYIIIGNLLRKRIKTTLLFFTTFFLFSIFYMEFYVLHVMTRISFLLSFISLIKIIDNFQNNKTSLKSNFGMLLLFIIAVLIRAESAAVVVLIMSGYYFLIINNQNFWAKFNTTFKLFILPALISGSVLVWVLISAKTSDEFYIKIEPDVEYELMVKNNFIPIESMKNKVDSMRYVGIYDKIWADATTNDDLFLRSLIANHETTERNIIQSAFAGIEESVNECKPVVLLNGGLFILLLLILLLRNPFKALKLLLFHSFFYLVIFMFSYTTKMVVTSLSPMMYGVSIAYLLLLLDFKNRETNYIFSILSILLIITQFVFLNNIVKVYSQEYKESRLVINGIENSINNRNLFLNTETINVLFKGFKPFQKIEIKGAKKIYAFDFLYMMTVQPYKKYLEQDCSCDPNNFKEFFNFVQKDKENNIFILTKERTLLYKEYLSIVHQINTSWKLIPYNESYKTQMKALKNCNFYVLE